MWQRIDDKHRLRNGGRGAYDLAYRAWGWKGKMWPRLVLCINCNPHPGREDSFGPEQTDRVTHRLYLSLDYRRCSGNCWWKKQRGIPPELLPEIPELLEEAAQALRERRQRQ